MKLYNVALLFVLLFFGACSAITPPIKKPIIEDNALDNRVSTFATVPSRRMVILKEMQVADSTKEKSKIDKSATKDIFVCAEPSADVSDNIASALSADLSASGGIFSSKASDEARAAFASALSTTAKQLFKRTQGLQLYRDAMYNLCQAEMNGLTVNYYTREEEILKLAKELISEEIKLNANRPIINLNVENDAETLAKVKKMLDDIIEKTKKNSISAEELKSSTTEIKPKESSTEEKP